MLGGLRNKQRAGLTISCKKKINGAQEVTVAALPFDLSLYSGIVARS